MTDNTLREALEAALALIQDLTDSIRYTDRVQALEEQLRAALAAPVVEAGAPTTVDLNLWKHRILPQGTEERRDVSPQADTSAVRIYPPEFPVMPADMAGWKPEDLWQHACLTGWRCADNATTAQPPAAQHTAQSRLSDELSDLYSMGFSDGSKQADDPETNEQRRAAAINLVLGRLTAACEVALLPSGRKHCDASHAQTHGQTTETPPSTLP